MTQESGGSFYPGTSRTPLRQSRLDDESRLRTLTGQPKAFWKSNPTYRDLRASGQRPVGHALDAFIFVPFLR